MKWTLPLVAFAIFTQLLLAEAQTKTPTPAPTPVPNTPFQDVAVGDFLFKVDPYFPCVLYLTRRVEELSGPQVVSTSLTFQGFHRDGENMVADPVFTTHESDITKDLRVGSTMTCQPQVAVNQP